MIYCMICLLEGGQDEQNKILQLSSELSEIQTHTTRESPIPSTKQSSTISDHTSTIGGSGVSSHGLGEDSNIM